MTESALIVAHLLEDMEPTAQWPEDFQIILVDYLTGRVPGGLPDEVPVKKVLAEPYLRQAKAMGYARGDTRRRPEYLANLSSFIERGGKVPPLVIDGDRLIDGRHRLLAMPGMKYVDAIDLKDFDPVGN